MQNTEEKTKSKFKSIKKLFVKIVAVVLIIFSLFISFGKPLGIPDWNDVFAFFGIYADLGDDLSASFVDVGTADACVISCHGKNILIDSGTEFSYRKLSAYLKRNKITHFDAFIISHLDSDHFGGANNIIKDFSVDKVYTSHIDESLIPETEEYKEFYDSLKENKIELIYPKIKSKIDVGDMELEFISPQKSYDSRNESSLVVRLVYGENSFLFTGDISKDVEEDLLNSDTELNSDVLKVAHHGSKTSSSDEFLKAVSPQISVVSVGNSNYSLPNYETMAQLNHYSKELYSTKDDKTIVITSDGQDLCIQTNA